MNKKENLVKILLMVIVSMVLIKDSFSSKCPYLATVPYLKIPAFMGFWYQIEDIPQIYEIACKSCTRATYTFNETLGLIQVDNQCQTILGGSKEACGYAEQIDPENYPGQLKVHFYVTSPYKASNDSGGDYWIMQLGPINGDGLYDYALVGHPCRIALYILAREPFLSPSVLKQLLDYASSQGYSIDRVVKTSQDDCNYVPPTCPPIQI
eukprot:TRINITY_DN270_c1_g5_i1.p1 TRINITY_DN270_c1_g5~~TRINITY_DN270_c1_g5_i1.p1  ORF type:complete len:209 (-),score=77.27 TRINITY_DN270_c1_g5_i1:77-703(-)